MRSRSRAFTLIELLTVIAIIGVLAAIIIGSVSKVRDAARRSTCVSNLRQIGAAFPLYAADNKGFYPAPQQTNYTTSPATGQAYPTPYSATNPPPGTNPSTQSWQVEITPYILRTQNYIWNVKDASGQTNIAHCPSYDLLFNTAASLSSQSNVSTAGYGMNVNMNVGGSNYRTGVWLSTSLRFKAAALTYPSKTVLVGDSSEYFINAGNAWTTDSLHVEGYNNGAPKRHGSTANYLFADGHVETLSPEAALVAVASKL
jgi:prepilin-type processing-associated H-X9-DG protein/prepilin-type N-terminal cleavage/methylation domain-containing protein